jgi:cellulose synthase/poly-beta-1,6-N-acetylglucosamine synthase-like glycosyltransferase
VTVVCVPRDHYHDAARSLDALLRHTDMAFELLYVIGRAPRDVLEHVRREAARVGFTLIERDRHLVPNHARNLALAQVDTEYVACIDNDTVVTPGWLSALVACADETGAALVGPLQLIGPPEDRLIHLAGGFIDIDRSATPHPIRLTHRYQWLVPDQVPAPLERARCDFAEFHCLLARTEALEAAGPLDERLLTAREVEDLALRLRQLGREVWFEPASEVTFLPPTRLRWSELGFVSRRWGERANRQTFEYFLDKYDLDRAHLSALGFANCQRRPIFGAVRERVGRLGGGGLARAVDYGLHRLERPVNRLLVRPGRTAY